MRKIRRARVPVLSSPPRRAYVQRGTSTLQQVLRDHFARFAAVYDSRYAKDLGNFRVERISRVATRFLTCGDYRKAWPASDARTPNAVTGTSVPSPARASSSVPRAARSEPSCSPSTSMSSCCSPYPIANSSYMPKALRVFLRYNQRLFADTLLCWRHSWFSVDNSVRLDGGDHRPTPSLNTSPVLPCPCRTDLRPTRQEGPLPHRLQSLLQAEHHPMVRPGFHRSTDPVHPALGRALRSLLRVVLLPMQGAMAALAPRRAGRADGLEGLASRATACRPWTLNCTDHTAARLSFSLGQADRKGVRGRSPDLPSLWIRDDAHRDHHQSFRGRQDPAPSHQDGHGTAGTRLPLLDLTASSPRSCSTVPPDRSEVCPLPSLSHTRGWLPDRPPSAFSCLASSVWPRQIRGRDNRPGKQGGHRSRAIDLPIIRGCPLAGGPEPHGLCAARAAEERRGRVPDPRCLEQHRGAEPVLRQSHGAGTGRADIQRAGPRCLGARAGLGGLHVPDAVREERPHRRPGARQHQIPGEGQGAAQRVRHFAGEQGEAGGQRVTRLVLPPYASGVPGEPRVLCRRCLDGCPGHGQALRGPRLHGRVQGPVQRGARYIDLDAPAR